MSRSIPFSMKNFSDKVVVKIKKNIMFSNFFNGKKYGRAREATDGDRG
jgi:hypothetical protein